jgi:hypothetical protein
MTDQEKMTDRDRIFLSEMMKLIYESARAKANGGLVLAPEQINNALVAFIAGYDMYVAYWGDETASRALVIRRSLKEEGDLRGNAVWVRDRATAIALHAACRAGDNVAPEPPEDDGRLFAMGGTKVVPTLQ